MKLKSAFTLAEIIFVIITIAVLMSALFAITKPQQSIADKTVKHRYAAAYDALNIVAYEIVKGPSAEISNPFAHLEGEGPPSYYDYLKMQRLSKGLRDYINNDNGSTFTYPTNNADYTYLQNEDQDFSAEGLTPIVTSLNGMKFYVTYPIRETVDEHEIEFFMVYVDLNGNETTNRPHTIKYDAEKHIHPDVFAFAIVPTGDAIPIGIAEYSKDYFPVRVSYPNSSGNKITTDDVYTYHQARRIAWNMYKPEENGINAQFVEDNPFTYGEYIKKILIDNGTKLYSFTTPAQYNGYNDISQRAECNTSTAYQDCNLVPQTPFFK